MFHQEGGGVLLSQDLSCVKRSLEIAELCLALFLAQCFKRSEKSQQHLFSITLTLEEGREELFRGFTALLRYFTPKVQLKHAKTTQMISNAETYKRASNV